MATPKRNCRLADVNHADVDLRIYSKVIILKYTEAFSLFLHRFAAFVFSRIYLDGDVGGWKYSLIYLRVVLKIQRMK